MSLIELPDLIQGTDEWHAQRRGIVTASVVGRLIASKPLVGYDFACPDCGALAGALCVSLAKKGSPSEIKTVHPGRADVARMSDAPPLLEVATGDDAKGLTALLVAERITGYTDPTYMSDDMLRGVEDEPRAVDVYSEHYAPVTTTGFFVRTEPTWTLGYSPDGLVGSDGLVEVKSRRQKKQLATILADEVPVENMAQLQAGLLVTGRAWIDYVSYCGGMPMYVKRVTPDPRWFDAIVAAVEHFENNAAEMVGRYHRAVESLRLPLTERVTDLEMIL